MKITLKILQRFSIAALSAFPFIFFAKKEMKKNKVLVNHEKIHWAQQIETLWIGFIVLYFGQYLYFRKIKKYTHRKAYKSLMMEREARENERDLEYLKKRKPWSFFKYLR